MRLIHFFNQGQLADLSEGTTMRAFLSERLRCEPMRVTKKLHGSKGLGKRVYRRSKEATTASMDVATYELAVLESRLTAKLTTDPKGANKLTLAGVAEATAVAYVAGWEGAAKLPAPPPQRGWAAGGRGGGSSPTVVPQMQILAMNEGEGDGGAAARWSGPAVVGSGEILAATTAVTAAAVASNADDYSGTAEGGSWGLGVAPTAVSNKSNSDMRYDLPSTAAAPIGATNRNNSSSSSGEWTTNTTINTTGDCRGGGGKAIDGGEDGARNAVQARKQQQQQQQQQYSEQRYAQQFPCLGQQQQRQQTAGGGGRGGGGGGRGGGSPSRYDISCGGGGGDYYQYDCNLDYNTLGAIGDSERQTTAAFAAAEALSIGDECLTTSLWPQQQQQQQEQQQQQQQQQQGYAAGVVDSPDMLAAACGMPRAGRIGRGGSTAHLESAHPWFNDIGRSSDARGGGGGGGGGGWGERGGGGGVGGGGKG